MDLSAGLSNLAPATCDLLGLCLKTTLPAVRTDVPMIQQQTRLPKSLVHELVSGYLAGRLVPSLATQFDINRDTVYEHLYRAGVTPNRTNKLGPTEVTKATALYRSGLSLAVVGEQFGVDAKTIRAALVNAGVAIRPRRGRPRDP